MKTKLIFFSILSFCLAIQIFAKPANKDSGSLQLIKDIQLNLEKEFYSLVIANVNQLEEKYPNSRFMEQANRCKLEALYFLGRKNEAKNLMEDLEFHEDVAYFKGRIFFMRIASCGPRGEPTKLARAWDISVWAPSWPLPWAPISVFGW